MQKSLSAILLAISVLLLSSVLEAAPASTYVKISDPAYRDIERLVSLKLCEPPMLDQRPFLAGEFARMIAEAIKRHADEEKNFSPGEMTYGEFSKMVSKNRYIDSVIERLKAKFHGELVDIGAIEEEKPSVRIVALDEFRVDGTYLSEAPLVIPETNGVGLVSAFVTPLSEYGEGRHAVDGFQFAMESTTKLRASDYFAALAHPRVEGDSWRTSFEEDMVSVLLQEGYGVAQFGDFAITLGRSSIVWGPGKNGGLILTNNARPLDQIQISTPSPFRLPWYFKYLGQWRLSLFGANLGPETVHRYAWLTGYRIALMPVKYLELSFGNTTTMGGEGTPDMSALDIFGEFWGFRPAGTSGADQNNSNHLMEATVKVRIPPLNGLTLYGILANEDKRDTLKRFFRDGSSYVGGFYLPKIDDEARSDFRFEFKKTCAIMYRHTVFVGGYTLDRLFLADDLGPDAMGVYARGGYELSDYIDIAASFGWDARSSNRHSITTDPDGTLGDDYVTEYRPTDTRYRFILEPTFSFGPNFKTLVYAGYERAVNAGYVEGLTRNNWLFAVSLRFDFGDKTTIELH